MAERWLVQKDAEAAERDRADVVASSQAANVLEEDANRLAAASNSEAREANRLAERAIKIAWISATAAIAALIVAIIAMFKGHQ